MRDRSAPLTKADLGRLAWDKMGGLLPTLVQDRRTGEALMLGYMNQEALSATLASRFATFFSRSKGRLWQKGETSGNRLHVHAVQADCDADALLVLAEPSGPVCHIGTPGCFDASPPPSGWLGQLSAIVADRARSGPPGSYTRKLLDEGPARIGQKVGEEGVELALAAVSRDKEGCIEEAADLIYHLCVLMEARGFGWEDVVSTLRERHSAPSK